MISAGSRVREAQSPVGLCPTAELSAAGSDAALLEGSPAAGSICACSSAPTPLTGSGGSPPPPLPINLQEHHILETSRVP